MWRSLLRKDLCVWVLKAKGWISRWSSISQAVWNRILAHIIIEMQLIYQSPQSRLLSEGVLSLQCPWEELLPCEASPARISFQPIFLQTSPARISFQPYHLLLISFQPIQFPAGFSWANIILTNSTSCRSLNIDFTCSVYWRKTPESSPSCGMWSTEA